MTSKTSKNTRPAKRRSADATKRPEKAHHRPLETIRAEIKATLENTLRKGTDRLGVLNAEFDAHPEGKRERAALPAAAKAEAAAQSRKATSEHRKEARFPVAVNPLTERDLGETLHNIECFADYTSLLEYPDDMGTNSDRDYGRYLLGRVIVSALKAACEQERFERNETREKHETELAKARGGVK